MNEPQTMTSSTVRPRPTLEIMCYAVAELAGAVYLLATIARTQPQWQVPTAVGAILLVVAAVATCRCARLSPHLFALITLCLFGALAYQATERGVTARMLAVLGIDLISAALGFYYLKRALQTAAARAADETAGQLAEPAEIDHILQKIEASGLARPIEREGVSADEID